MVRSVVALLLALAAVVAGSTAQSGELRREVVNSPSLGRELPFLVYVPDGYDGSTSRYPVLYLLHGAGADETAWAERANIADKADQLIESRAIPPTLIVMPGCPRCWWIDGPKDKAETAFWGELVPAVTQRYRTIERREGRLIAGLSAGGYGAIRFLLRYPERIAAAAAFSPAIYASSPPVTSAARTTPAFLDAAGRFSQEAWDAANYPHLIESYFGQRMRVPVFLASGDNDKLGVAFETALLFSKLYQRQPSAVELRIVDGGHNWAVWSAVIDEAMRYMYRFALPPQPVATLLMPDGPVLAQVGKPGPAVAAADR